LIHTEGGNLTDVYIYTVDKQMKKEAFLLDNTGKNSYRIDIDLVFIKILSMCSDSLKMVASTKPFLHVVNNRSTEGDR